MEKREPDENEGKRVANEGIPDDENSEAIRSHGIRVKTGIHGGPEVVVGDPPSRPNP